MMYSPFKLREHQGKAIPKGPNFNRARIIQCCIDDTCISFNAPRHRPVVRGYKPTFPQKQYKFVEMYFRSNYDENKIADNWKTCDLFLHHWAFYGPWFSGSLAQLKMRFELFTPIEPKPRYSYFHPRAFIQVVGDYLSNEFANLNWYGRSEYIAPVNWQPMTHLGVPAARLDVIPEELIHHPSKTHYVFFPIADHVMACMQFVPSRLLNKPQEDLDKRIDPKPVYDLMDNIINSIQLTLSDTAKAQQAAAIKGLEDTSVVDEFLPMKWTTPEQDAEWEAYSQNRLAKD